MDSTLITIACIDELADFAGLKPQVAAITEAAMRGELNFEQSLTRRVALLAGLDASALDHVYQERLRPNPGAETLLAGLAARGITRAPTRSRSSTASSPAVCWARSSAQRANASFWRNCAIR